MKSKFLALAVSMLMVASSVNAFALETVDVETSDEFSVQNDAYVSEDADLMSEVVPGINLLTGDGTPYTFDLGLGAYVSRWDDDVSLVMEGDNSVLSASNSYNGYHNGVKFWTGSTVIDRKVRVSFKYKSTVQNTGLLVRRNNGATTQQVGATAASTSNGWTTYYADLDVLNADEVIGTHVAHASAPYTDYYDDISVMPFYKVTYKNSDGSVLKEVYVEPDQTSFKLPSKSELGTDFYPVYTTSTGAEYLPGASYPLNYEDIELTVGETNLLVYEGFDSIGAGHDFNTAGKDFTAKPSYDALGNVSIVNGDEPGNNGLYITTVDDEGNTVAKITGSRGNYSCVGFKFLHLNFTEPGTYHINVNAKMESGNLAGRLWTQALGSKAPAMEGTNVLPADVWHTLGWTVDVSKDSSGKYTYTISNSSGNVNSFEADSAFGDATWQVYFAPSGANVVVYVDDLSIIYEAPKTVTAKFVSGSTTVFSETAECFEGRYILPTAAELGLDYNPSFEIDGEDYLPGEAYYVSDGVSEIQFTVSETNIVLRENFGKRYIHTVPSTAGGIIHDFSYKAPGYDGGLAGADFNDAKVLTTKTVNGRNVLEFADKSAQQYHALGFYGLSGIKEVGTYQFKVVLKTDLDAGSFVLNDKNGKYSTSAGWVNQYIADGNGYITVLFDIEVYDNDGTLYIRYTENNKVDNSPVIEKEYTDGMLQNMMFYIGTSSVTTKILFDEFSVAFTPYDPTADTKYAPHWYNDATDAKDVAEIRVQKDTEGNVIDNKSGLRFKGYIEYTYKTDEKLTEYGFIVARTDVLKAADNAELTHTFKPEGVVTPFISHANYIKGTDTDLKLYPDSTLQADVFSCVLVNIPMAHYGDEFTVRAWSKVDGEYQYGTSMSVSIIDILNSLDDERKAAAQPLIDKYNEWLTSQPTEG